MPVVATWDGVNRLIYLASGVTEFHPIIDIYREYVDLRLADESFRVWEPLMRAVGNDPKGGGKFTSRYLSLLNGTKIVPADEDAEITVTGEVLTDDQTAPFDTSLLSAGTKVTLNYQPPDTEVIEVQTGGGGGISDQQMAQLTGLIWLAGRSGYKVELVPDP